MNFTQLCAVIALLTISHKMPQATRTQVSPKTSVRDVPTVTVCQLIRHPITYNQKTVRLTAILATHYHGPYIYDPECKAADSIIDVIEAVSFVVDSKVKETLDDVMKAVCNEHRVCRGRVTVIARLKDSDDG